MEDLLSLGRPRREESMQTLSLTTLVEKALANWLQTMQPVIPAVQFIKPQDSGACMIEADSASMTQIIINLLENAFNHSIVGTEIVLSVYIRPPAVIAFSVKDRGAGIPEQHLKKIFEPFFTTRKGGTGLGLSIVRRIVDNHQGSITARNNTDGPGATFEIMLPLYNKV
jgi:signal transduction histidine kinase